MQKARISDLSFDEFRRRLQGNGICIETGPFLVSVQSALPSFSNHLHRLYEGFELTFDDSFSDINLRIIPHGLVRRYLFQQIRLVIDDTAPFNTLPARLAMPLFEWGLNWAISRHANQYLIIHAAVVEKSGRALILASPPGSGKSTLCAALSVNGWRLLSDELALIRPDSLDVVPIPRPVSLKNNSIDLIASLSSKAMIGPRFLDTSKGTVAHMIPPAEDVIRSRDSAPIGWMVFPSYREGADTLFEEVSRGRGVLRAADNSFNYSLLGTRGFEALCAIAERSGFYDLVYGNLDEAIAKIESLLKPE
jgi:hypothetical protein